MHHHLTLSPHFLHTFTAISSHSHHAPSPYTLTPLLAHLHCYILILPPLPSHTLTTTSSYHLLTLSPPPPHTLTTTSSYHLLTPSPPPPHTLTATSSYHLLTPSPPPPHTLTTILHTLTATPPAHPHCYTSCTPSLLHLLHTLTATPTCIVCTGVCWSTEERWLCRSHNCDW